MYQVFDSSCGLAFGTDTAHNRQVPGTSAAQARALVAAGITNPELLATRPREEVVAALSGMVRATALHGSRGDRPTARCKAVDGGATGDLAANRLVARMATALQEAALRWVREAAVEASQGDATDTGNGVNECIFLFTL